MTHPSHATSTLTLPPVAAPKDVADTGLIRLGAAVGCPTLGAGAKPAR